MECSGIFFKVNSTNSKSELLKHTDENVLDQFTEMAQGLLDLLEKAVKVSLLLHDAFEPGLTEWTCLTHILV